jgi:dCMP deaminase
MRLAGLMAERSTCRRLAVGAVITTTDFRRVLAVGYNGNASGLANDCDSDSVGACGCLHAEENAVINCAEPRSTEKIVFCTHLPCPACAKRLINLGNVRSVWFLHDYRVRTSVDMLFRTGITCTQLVLGRELAND